jgi:hypothetical protein
MEAELTEHEHSTGEDTYWVVDINVGLGKRKVFSEYPTLAQAMADVAASHWDDEMHLKVVTLKAYNKYNIGDDNA